MKKTVAILCISAFVIAANAEISNEKNTFQGKQTAGYVIKEGSQKGTFTFINTQTEVEHQVIEDAAELIRDDLRIKVITKKTEAGDAAKLVRDSEGVLGVVVVADDVMPALLVAPEDGWAIVNVRKLSVGLTTKNAREKFLAIRVKHELVRAFAAVAGGLGSMYPGNIMSATSLSELEMASNASLPVDTKTAVERFLKSRGYSPALRLPYRKACQEGWAPEPTNEFQRVIWEKVKAEQSEKPTNPIKILPGDKVQVAMSPYDLTKGRITFRYKS